ncbi:hypothetical protein PsorP6_015012 [Peronosclerospora sorghi]|uniref:Uncharacterized protein n=1 Tax=Peronosclerospora sorghi TaxID=230839 RepID=A0ACC0VTS0_9STRA|nr:hypothetical protein PsorP6_015012 [Peronosclerospora sorghi]
MQSALEQTLKCTKVKKLTKEMFRTAAQLDNGFSGGAAVDKKGQLVGLISFSVLRQDRLVSAINMVKGAIEHAKHEYNFS